MHDRSGLDSRRGGADVYAYKQPDHSHDKQQHERAEEKQNGHAHRARTRFSFRRLAGGLIHRSFPEPTAASMANRLRVAKRFHYWVSYGRITKGIRGTHAMVGRFHAVSIHGPGSACTAAKELRETRFLSDDAPDLPLPTCSNRSACRCRYRHFDDRRIDFRRDVDFGLPSRIPPGDERRQVRGRRVSDLAVA